MSGLSASDFIVDIAERISLNMVDKLCIVREKHKKFSGNVREDACLALRDALCRTSSVVEVMVNLYVIDQRTFCAICEGLEKNKSVSRFFVHSVRSQTIRVETFDESFNDTTWMSRVANVLEKNSFLAHFEFVVGNTVMSYDFEPLLMLFGDAIRNNTSSSLRSFKFNAHVQRKSKAIDFLLLSLLQSPHAQKLQHFYLENAADISAESSVHLSDLILRDRLVTLGLHSTRVRAEEMRVLFAAVKKSRKLRTLEMCEACGDNRRGGGIGDEMFSVFADMVKENVSLTRVDFFEPTSAEGRLAMVEAMEKNGRIVDFVTMSCNIQVKSYLQRNLRIADHVHQVMVVMMAIKRWRNVFINVPKEIIIMLIMAIGETIPDLASWSNVVMQEEEKQQKQQNDDIANNGKKKFFSLFRF